MPTAPRPNPRRHAPTAPHTATRPAPETDATILAFPIPPAPDASEPTPTASSPGTPPRSIHDYLTDGLLTPPPLDYTHYLPEGTDPRTAERIRREMDAAETFRQRATSENTRRAYGRHLLAFTRWCDEVGETPLPASAHTVARHLAWFVTAVDTNGDVTRDHTGEPVGAVTASTVSSRIAAINAVHRLAGYPRPGDDPTVRQVITGIRRSIGTRQKYRKRAIDHAGIRAMVAAALADQFPVLRSQALLLLRAQGLTAGRITLIHWADVTITPDAVHINVPNDKRGKHPTPVHLPANPAHPKACPVEVFTRLRDAAPGVTLGHVFTQTTNPRRVLTRQALAATCDRLASSVGGYKGLTSRQPGSATQRARIARIVEAADTTPTTANTWGIRDAALLVTGFYLALRRSNLESLTWGDLTFERDMIVVLIQRSKTDQEGAGRTLWLPDLPADADPGIVSPTAALRTWRDTLTNLLGAEPYDTDPVFCGLGKTGLPQRNRLGNLPRLSAATVNKLVQRYAREAQLPDAAPTRGRSPYGAHSLRAGFVTESLRDGKLSIGEVMDITGHTSPDMVLQYRREADRTTATSISRMLGSITSDKK